MLAKSIMLQGTSSNVGKSVLAAAFCRIFYRKGYKVVPFKSQNMALNSFVTASGGEMGRAQVVQAQAAGLAPDVKMNPVLLKPTGNASSQVILLGRPVGNMGAREYHLEFNTKALGVIEACLEEFQNTYDVLVIEGAGSPAEVNLKARDIANMRIAFMASAPVLLVADIDRGGALASVVGTLELLTPEERDLIKGIIINKFRGDKSLLQPAVDFLEEKTGKPVLGIIPYFSGIKIPEEDSVVLEEKISPTKRSSLLDIAVIWLPRISNFTDFDALADEQGVNLRYIKEDDDLLNPDLIIIPGSKNSIEDLLYLKKSGKAAEIKKLSKAGTPIIGICGGYQMLGDKLMDPQHTESSLVETEGLGLLAMTTSFEPAKVTRQARGKIIGHGPLLQDLEGETLNGYEIHMGRTVLQGNTKPALLMQRDGQEGLEDGAVSEDGLIMGTYLHGIFDNDLWRRHLLNYLRQRKGLAKYSTTSSFQEQQDIALDKLAELVEENMDVAKLFAIMDLERK